MSIREFKKAMINKLGELDFNTEVKALKEFAKKAFSYKVDLKKYSDDVYMLGQYTETYTIALEINKQLGIILGNVLPVGLNLRSKIVNKSLTVQQARIYCIDIDIQRLINDFEKEINKFCETI